MYAYTVDDEMTWWPGMDEPGYMVTVMEDGDEVCIVQVSDTDPATVAEGLALAGYGSAVAA